MTVQANHRLRTNVRYLSIGLACWIIGSLAFYAGQNVQSVGRIDIGLLVNVAVLSVVFWITVLPSQVLCCSVIRFRDAMLAGDPSLDCARQSETVPWRLATAVEVAILVACLTGFYEKWVVFDMAALRDLLPLFSAFFFALALVMALLYRWFLNNGERYDSVRVLVAWPSLLIYGMNLMGGCACQVYIGNGSPETVVPYMVVYALFTAAYLLFDLLLSTERGFVRQDGTRVALPGPYALIPIVLFLVCSYLGRLECLFALLGCIFYSTFEALRAIDVRRGCGFSRSDDVIRRCEAIAGIARILLLPASMIIVSFSFGQYMVDDAKDEIIAVAAVKAYEIVAISSLVVLSGYASSALLRRFWAGDEKESETRKGLPAQLYALYDYLFVLVRSLWHPLSIVIPAAILLAPFLYSGNIINLAWLPRDASRLVAALGVFGGVAGIFSFAYSSTEAAPQSPSKVGPAAVRERLEDRMESYLRVESFLTDGTATEGDAASCRGGVSYGRTLRDMLIVCIFLGLIFGAMFSAPGGFFYCFALVFLVLLIVSYLFDFFFTRRGAV